jgi:hypothetical protein
MSNAIVIAIAAGIVGGALPSYSWSKGVAFRLSRQSVAPYIVVACSSAGALLMLPLVFFVSFVVGGNLGGSYGEAASNALGLGSIGVPLGLAAGIAFVLVAGCVTGAFIGGLFGKAVSYVWARAAAP